MTTFSIIALYILARYSNYVSIEEKQPSDENPFSEFIGPVRSTANPCVRPERRTFGTKFMVCVSNLVSFSRRTLERKISGSPVTTPRRGASSGCGWRRRSADMQGSCGYTEQGFADTPDLLHHHGGSCGSETPLNAASDVRISHSVLLKIPNV
jgi:hypothetical protein